MNLKFLRMRKNVRIQTIFLILLIIVQAVTVLPVQADTGASKVSATIQPMKVEASPLRAGEPQLILTKTIEDNLSEVQVGDIIRYRIRWECSSLTTSCGQMEITDVLQNGLEYLGPPNSSVPSGFNLNYNSGTRTVTITKADNNLIDGTQYDAVIVVRVSFDYRPPPSTINNTINGRIDPPGPVGWQNAIPASAPPIAVGSVSPSWALSKVRIAPVIEPTVDTEVTYRLRLCPVTPPSGGIAALTNIVLTDTLPPNSIFISASDGGTESGGVVTWPTIAGPLYPPDCVSRLITILYPTPDFSIGDTLTNSASVTASYVDSNGNNCPNCFAPTPSEITHDIIDILDVPTYSKSDTGDPVGITGTARFILNLNTNGTNYPANNVTLIDNLPPELRVTSVTSGTWSSSFDYVRAFVEYSTDNGDNWTAFSASPVLYNTNATYTAPTTNITNVRWRFEYDADLDGNFTAGLPYVWQFTNRPEIRVTPRATATSTTNIPPLTLPTASVNTTYTNCVYVTRTNASGSVTDPCDNEDMTVRGDYASLRVGKSETPGEPWDEFEDPNITNFVSDASILPGDTLRYVISLEMTERSSASLINPTILDTLPADLIFVRAGNARLNNAPLPPGATVTFTHSGPNPGAGQTLLWEFAGLTIPQQPLNSNIITVEFFARIPRGQSPGSRTNIMQAATDSLDVFCENGFTEIDTTDMDSDGNTTEKTCRGVDTYVVDRSAALRGEKWIRSVDALNAEVVNKDTFLPDASCPTGGTSGLPGSTNPFTRFPCISLAFPEGALNPGQYTSPPPGNATLDDFEYQLRIFNDGNVDMLDYVLYDILPYYGDRGSGGTLENTPRESEFRPVMTGPITFLGGGGLISTDFTVEYNLSTNPCRPEVFNQNSGALVPTGCNNTWVPSVVDWSTVRSYRIRLNTNKFIAPYTEGDTTNIIRFAIPMSIPKDAPIVGFFNNDDPQTLEIAWNSFSHVGSYQDLNSNIRDLLASEPRKVGITIPERFSIGNRVWRDSDNSGTINPPDDTNPGISGVLVHLYNASDTSTPIATTTTDSGGYYLFSNLPAGDYVVGIPASNFTAGQPLENLRSSTGTPASATYTNPTDPNPDRTDHGIDPAVLGNEVFSPIITLSADSEQTNETDLSSNDRDGPPATRRGLNGERDNNSDLTVDFGFFGGTDIPFSIGNHLWFDNGNGGGILNNGIRDGSEPPVAGARVELYRDGNGNNIAEPDEFIRFDVTDTNGFYLFDNLDPGTYFVLVAAGNFTTSFDPDGPGGAYSTAPGVLRGWYSSQPTGTETTGVNGGTSTADIDSDDNGVNTDTPEITGVISTPVVLVRGVNEPTGETHLSGDTSMVLGFNPTAGDGTGSIGRFGETDATSNMTIDFGFIPPMSLGNRVWFDSGAGEPTFRAGYNNGIQDGSEPGVAGVRVELWRDTNGVAGLQVSGGTPDTFLRFTTTDANGYYLFERLQPGDNYYVHIPASNFAVGQPLRNYISSNDSTQATLPADDNEDKDDNGIDSANPAATGISSSVIVMAYGTEPQNTTHETDYSPNTAVFGVNNVGIFPGQTDLNSNLTIDFGFVRAPRSLGNRLWFDTGAGTNTNNGILNADETPVVGARVSLYLDNDNNGIPDDLGVIGDASDDWIAWDITDNNGYYLFDNLPPNRYLIGVDADNFDAGGTYSALNGFTSSTSAVDNASNNTDSLDNGLDRLDPTPTGSPYGILSTTIDFSAAVLTGVPTTETGSGNTSSAPGFNPTAGDGPNSRGRYGETNGNSDLTIDFGFVETYSLGNRVWFDTNNNSLMDSGEVGVANVQVALYHADASGNPTTAVIANGVPRVTVTNANGYYLFDYLAPGHYVVIITADNFIDSGAGDPYKALVGYWSSGTSMQANGATTESAAPDPDLGPDGAVGGGDDDLDLDDNGMLQSSGTFSGAVISPAVTLGFNGNTEPVNEADLNGGSQGSPPDGRANMTVDFGFYRTALGNLVFNDLDKDGAFNNLDTPIQSTTVRLYATDTTGSTRTLLRTTTTDASGLYNFTGIPAGNYIVSVDTPSGASSSRDDYDSNDNANPDWNTDNNDNGLGTGTGEVFSEVVTLTPGGGSRPNSSPKPNVQVTQADGTTTDPTVDFGFVATTYALGNRVWFDTNNNSVIDAGEVGVNGVAVELYAANDLSTVLASDTTANGGYYLFDNLPAGDYVVRIAASNFASGGALHGYWSSATSVDANGNLQETAAPDPDNDSDSDDNGVMSGGVVSSLAVTLGPDNSEPTNESDLEGGTPPVGQGTNPNARANMTVDFGFYQVSVGNLVFIDVNENGTYDAGDVLMPGATVELMASDGVTPISFGSGTTTTAPDGTYRFTGLPEGSYIIRVTPAVGYVSTVDTADATDTNSPDTNTDNNDNGIGENAGRVASNPVSLVAGDIGAQSGNTVTNATGTTYNPTVDFGFRSNNGLYKTILNTSETHTTGTFVTIGELITYEIRFNLPIGIALDDVNVTDRMDKGLAFAECLLVEVAGVDVTNSVCPAAIVSSITDPGDLATNPANPGRQVIFSLGDIAAQNSATQVVIQYQAVVLNTLENTAGVSLNNDVTWAWSSGSFGASAPDVEIQEPFLSIEKTADQVSGVPLGTPLTFTLVIEHISPQSQTDAFDVVLTDILPAELGYVQCTVQYDGLAPDTPASDYCNPGATTTDLIFRWDVFPLGQTATIRFNAVLLGSPATNVASVEWTSLEIDPGLNGPVERSPHNSRSTERWYDPPSGISFYTAQSSLSINQPQPTAAELPDLLPKTGFAPGHITYLLPQTEEKQYRNMNLILEIPSMSLKTPIVGVPQFEGEWDVSWLGNNVGWLNGTAFPTWTGNSVLTAHVINASGVEGPFATLRNLTYGDQIIVHLDGVKYVYEVRNSRLVRPASTKFAYESLPDHSYLTLITCQGFNPLNETYLFRRVVRAVLVNVIND